MVHFLTFGAWVRRPLAQRRSPLFGSSSGQQQQQQKQQHRQARAAVRGDVRIIDFCVYVRSKNTARAQQRAMQQRSSSNDDDPIS